MAYTIGMRDYDQISALGIPIILLSKNNGGHGGDSFQAKGDFNTVNLAWLNWKLKGMKRRPVRHCLWVQAVNIAPPAGGNSNPRIYRNCSRKNENPRYTDGFDESGLRRFNTCWLPTVYVENGIAGGIPIQLNILSLIMILSPLGKVLGGRNTERYL
jgi:hypothetical protein